MNTWNHLEEQFRSWTPRRPSAHLKGRIFNGERGTRNAERRALTSRGQVILWQWFAPAMAVCVLVLGLSSPSSNGFTPVIVSPMNDKLSSLALQDADFSTYVGSSSHSSHNGYPVATFEWTNRSKPVSTTGPVREVWSTNRLMR